MQLKKAVISMLLACALSAPMFSIIKASFAFAGIMEVLLCHFFFAGIVTGLLCLRLKRDQWKIKGKRLLLVRIFFGLFTTIGIFVATSKMPIVHVSLLLNTAPLFVPLISLVWLKEKLSWPLWMAIFVGFSGVVLVLNPSGELSLVGAFLGLSGAMASAFSMVICRKLVKDNHPLILSFFLILAGFLVLACMLPWTYEPISLKLLLNGALSGTLFALELYVFTKAFEYASASWLGPFNYAGVLMAGLVGFFVWGHVPTILGWVGMGLVMLGGSTVFVLPSDKGARPHRLAEVL